MAQHIKTFSAQAQSCNITGANPVFMRKKTEAFIFFYDFYHAFDVWIVSSVIKKHDVFCYIAQNDMSSLRLLN